MSEWTVYDGTNPPTKKAGHSWIRWARRDKGGVSYVVFSYDTLPPEKATHYMYLPDVPEPELLPCRCGGVVKDNPVHHKIGCGGCGATVSHLNPTERIRMWNAAMAYTKADEDKYDRECSVQPEPDMPEMIIAWPESDQGKRTWITANPSDEGRIKNGRIYIKKSKYDEVVNIKDAILQQARGWAMEAKTQHSIVRKCGAIVNLPDWEDIAGAIEAKLNAKPQEPKVCRWTLKGRNWDMSCRPNGWTAHMNHPIVDSYKHCPCCGKPIEVER